MVCDTEGPPFGITGPDLFRRRNFIFAAEMYPTRHTFQCSVKEMAKQNSAKVKDGGNSAPLLVDPLWIVKMLGAVIVAALLCGYLVLCLLFWQGAWQLVLHPEHTSALLQLPGIKTEPARFAIDETGRPQLTGYWIPSDGQYAALYLRGGDGALATSAHDAQNILLLHHAGFHVLAFDYRGYGETIRPHPSEKSMQQDAQWAYTYLTETRGFTPDHLLIFGDGIGASLAGSLTSQHASIAALVLRQPDASAVQRVKDDPRGRLVPSSLLLRDRFNLTPTLQNNTVPKLLLHSEASIKSPNDIAVEAAFQQASSPKMSVFLPLQDDGNALQTALSRFLDERLPAAKFHPSQP